jgi:hypothetical protein
MGGYSSSSSGSPSSKGTAKQAKNFAKKNKPTPVRDFITGGGITGVVIRAIKTAKKKSKQNLSPSFNNNNENPQGIELAKASAPSSSILSPKEIQKQASNKIKGPTSVEMNADQILLANKRKGRKINNLTAKKTLAKDYKLSQKTLLG